MKKPETLSLGEARRMAILAQGVSRGAERDGCASGVEVAPQSEVRRTIDRLGLLQIDSVNVLARAHTLHVYSRLGAYDQGDLHTLAYNGKRRSLFEYWGHAASLIPVSLQPLLRWRMQDALEGRNIYSGLVRFADAHRPLIDAILKEIEQRGPCAVGDFAAHGNRASGWWGWSDAKCALEWLFWTGQVTTATRRATFERVYDITERVLPDHVLATPTPDPVEARRTLIELSARALGVATEAHLRDYWRLDRASARRAIAELVEAGALARVMVEGWSSPAYVHTQARAPKSVAARTLLCPFDPMVWNRDRAETLFGARIRIEIYTPKAKRTHGYYVLPFLLGERVAARVDLKAERSAGVLQVLSAHSEPGVAPDEFAASLAQEIRLMARWLKLPHIQTSPVGDAAKALGALL